MARGVHGNIDLTVPGGGISVFASTPTGSVEEAWFSD